MKFNELSEEVQDKVVEREASFRLQTDTDWSFNTIHDFLNDILEYDGVRLSRENIDFYTISENWESPTIHFQDFEIVDRKKFFNSVFGQIDEFGDWDEVKIRGKHVWDIIGFSVEDGIADMNFVATKYPEKEYELLYDIYNLLTELDKFDRWKEYWEDKLDRNLLGDWVSRFTHPYVKDDLKLYDEREYTEEGELIG